MASWLIMILTTGVLIATSITRVDASEDKFIYVDRMPETRGELESKATYDDQESGHKIVQTLYTEEFDHAFIETYVYELGCLGVVKDAGLSTYIVAIKYPPKKPSTFAVATLHDIFKEVYVEDWSGRIRLYEDVGGQAMLTLSDRFKPDCQPI